MQYKDFVANIVRHLEENPHLAESQVLLEGCDCWLSPNGKFETTPEVGSVLITNDQGDEEDDN